MKSQNKKMMLLDICNTIAITFYIVAIPGYFFFDYRIWIGRLILEISMIGDWMIMDLAEDWSLIEKWPYCIVSGLQKSMK